MPDLRHSLLDYDTEVLRAIAASRGIEAEQSRTELIEALATESARPLAMSLLWEQLGTREQQALNALATRGGFMRAVYFEHEYGEVRHFGPGRLVRERLWEQPANTTERLFFLGLIFHGFEEGGQAAIWYIPMDLLPLLPVTSHTAATADKPMPIDEDVTITRPANDYLLRAVFQVILAARRREHQLVPSVIRRLATEADAPDEERLAYFVTLAVSLAQEMRFLDGNRITEQGIALARKWLRLAYADSLAEVASAWLQATGWHELLHAPSIVFEGGRLPDAVPARQRLCQMLGNLDVGSWYGIAALKRWLYAENPDFLRQDGDFSGPYLRDGASGEPLDGIAAWAQVEGRFTDEVLATLNALSALSLGSHGEQRCFRLEPGSFWMRGAAPPAADVEPELKISPDLTLERSPTSSLYLHYQLETVAEPSQLPNQFRITRLSLRRALKANVGLGKVIAFLRAHAAGFGPDLQRSIEALAAPPVLHATPHIVLVADDQETMAAIMADAAMAVYGVEVLPGNRLLVAPAVWHAVEARLASQGFRIRRKNP
ncbi:MAG: hypothetical protein ACUVWR_03840 [Anaerolineae bacterium]